MTGPIQNRDSFLLNIASKLGRKPQRVVKRPIWRYNPQNEVLKGATKDELVDVLKEQCKSINTDFVITTMTELPKSLNEVVINYGGGPIITWKDNRFEQYGLTNLMQQEWPQAGINLHIWDHTKGEENIKKADQANIGITISEMTLAESGTAVLLSSKDRGRTVSFLPKTSVIIIPKSTIVPRMTQVAQFIRKKINNGDKIASCVNFITGPSNSADIEMIPIIGVHGPIKVTYIVVEDL